MGALAAAAAASDARMPAALAAVTALAAWVLTGWDGADVLRAARAVHVAALAEARLLARALEGLAAPLARAFGLGGAQGRQVTLGEVSEMTDVVRLGLLAGLSFDAALGLFCEYRTGPLAERLGRALLAWQVGAGTREDELAAAARDLDVRALESFASAVGQALALGAPLAGTLAGQSREMRAAHRAEVERRIERAPVKMLIPTGTLILPALLLSILGPLLAAGGMI